MADEISDAKQIKNAGDVKSAEDEKCITIENQQIGAPAAVSAATNAELELKPEDIDSLSINNHSTVSLEIETSTETTDCDDKITQTDRLNKQLLNAFLQKLNNDDQSVGFESQQDSQDVEYSSFTDDDEDMNID